jgi:hypothetical protein
MIDNLILTFIPQQISNYLDTIFQKRFNVQKRNELVFFEMMEVDTSRAVPRRNFNFLSQFYIDLEMFPSSRGVVD